MDFSSKIMWLGEILLAGLEAILTSIGFIKKNKFKHPIKSALMLFTLFAAILGVFISWVFNQPYLFIVVFVLFSITPTYFVYYAINRENALSIVLGEKIISSQYNIDLHIAFILDQVLHRRSSKKTIEKSIILALTYILDQVAILFRRKDFDGVILSVLQVKGKGNFKVIASNFPPKFNKKIEQTLFCGEKSIGVAGYVANTKEPKCIPDISNKKNGEGNLWVDIMPWDHQKGSIMCYPIVEGIGENDARTIAVVNISSKYPQEDFCDIVEDVTRVFVTKIEILLYCLQLAKKMR